MAFDPERRPYKHLNQELLLLSIEVFPDTVGEGRTNYGQVRKGAKGRERNIGTSILGLWKKDPQAVEESRKRFCRTNGYNDDQFTKLTEEEQSWVLNLGRVVRLVQLAREMLIRIIERPSQKRLYKEASTILEGQLSCVLQQWKICSTNDSPLVKLQLLIQQLEESSKQLNSNSNTEPNPTNTTL